MTTEAAIEAPAGAPAVAATTVRPSEAQALRFWLRLGMISFGGPAGQIAIMHDELVERRRWISEGRFLHPLNFCMAPSGPEAQPPPTFGYSMYGVRGAITAGGLFVLPSFLLLCALSAIYVEYGEVAAVAGIVRGLGAAVIALVAAAVIRVGGRVIHTPAAFVLAGAAFGLIVADVPSANRRARRGRRLRRRVPTLGSARKARRPRPGGGGAAFAARDQPAPPFREDAPPWLVPLAALLLAGGLVAELAGFFTLAALSTFGGPTRCSSSPAPPWNDSAGSPRTTWSRAWRWASRRRGR